MIRTLIVDDESLARANIAMLLARDPEISIVGECGSGTQAIEAVRASKSSLLFLDVQMPGCDGFDVLESLGGDGPGAVVFVTAYDKYAIQAFKVEALDFLLKPFDDAHFFRTLARAKARCSNARPNSRESSGSSSRAPAVLSSFKQRKSIGSRRPTITPACAWGRERTSSAAA